MEKFKKLHVLTFAKISIFCFVCYMFWLTNVTTTDLSEILFQIPLEINMLKKKQMIIVFVPIVHNKINEIQT